MAVDKNYTAIQLAYRAKFLQLQKAFETEYSQIATELNKRIQAIVDKYTGADGTIKKSAIDDINRELDQVARWFTLTATTWLDKNISQSINLATTGQDAAAMYYIKALMTQQGGAAAGLFKQYSATIQQQYGMGLNGIVKLVRDQVWQRRWQDGYTLSDRIWTVDKTLRQNLHGMIETCVNEGRSAVDFSRGVEMYLEVPGPKWTTAIRPAKTERGTIKYNALRLARTETNQAYHRAHELSAQSSAIVKGLKWCLSGSHPKPDICDQYATQDLYGLGPGVYPVGKVPEDHPQGLCYLVDVLYQGSELIDRLKQKYNVA